MESTVFSNLHQKIERDPFPHLMRANALADRLYQELSASFPSLDTIAHGRKAKASNAAIRLPSAMSMMNESIPPLWRSFVKNHVSQSFWQEIVAAFGDSIRSLYPDLESRVGRRLEEWRAKPRDAHGKAEIEIDCQIVMNTPVTIPSSVKTAHLDHPRTLLAALLYMPDPREVVFDGGFVLGRWVHDPRILGKRLVLPMDWEPIARVPYKANQLVAFINHQNSIHAVEERGITDIPRRYVNIIAEVSFPLFKVRHIGPIAWFSHRAEVRKTSQRSIKSLRR